MQCPTPRSLKIRKWGYRYYTYRHVRLRVYCSLQRHLRRGSYTPVRFKYPLVRQTALACVVAILHGEGEGEEQDVARWTEVGQSLMAEEHLAEDAKKVSRSVNEQR